MKQRPRITSRAAACVLLATLTAMSAGHAGAAADAQPAAATTTVPSSTTTLAGPAATTTTATTTVPGASTTTTVAPTTTIATTTTTTTIPPSTTSTTLDRVQLAMLVRGLDTEVARAQAINDYLAAHAAAAQVAAGNPPPSVVDADLVQAAAVQLNATAVQTATQQRYDQVRRGIGQVALSIYLGEQVPRRGSPLTGTVAERSTILSAVLEEKHHQLKAATQELARATDSFNKSQTQASRAVEARTLQLQAAAALRPLTASAPATAARAPASAQATPAPPTGASLRLLGPAILGSSLLSADELVGWYTSTGHRANLTVPLSALVSGYLAVGIADGVRADIAFAQSMLETDYFGFPGHGQVAVSDNNFAGIGACDSCATGFHFPDARTGVLAQFQLLHAYATTGQPVAGPLTGPFGVSGCCPTWMALTGVWATSPDYGVLILKIYRAMVRWAVTQRAAAAGL